MKFFTLTKFSCMSIIDPQQMKKKPFLFRLYWSLLGQNPIFKNQHFFHQEMFKLVDFIKKQVISSINILHSVTGE